jgi:hypothetical protein
MGQNHIVNNWYWYPIISIHIKLSLIYIYNFSWWTYFLLSKISLNMYRSSKLLIQWNLLTQILSV